MQPKTIPNIFLILLTLPGIGAIFGGGILIISPSGQFFGMPLSMLENSPFGNFLMPGIILFSVLGVMPCCIVWALIKRPEYKIIESFNFYPDMYWAWTYSIYVSFALIIWIQMEMYYIQSVHWSHMLYMCWAIAIIFTALLPDVRKFYKK